MVRHSTSVPVLGYPASSAIGSYHSRNDVAAAAMPDFVDNSTRSTKQANALRQLVRCRLVAIYAR